MEPHDDDTKVFDLDGLPRYYNNDFVTRIKEAPLDFLKNWITHRGTRGNFEGDRIYFSPVNGFKNDEWFRLNMDDRICYKSDFESKSRITIEKLITSLTRNSRGICIRYYVMLRKLLEPYSGYMDYQVKMFNWPVEFVYRRKHRELRIVEIREHGNGNTKHITVYLHDFLEDLLEKEKVRKRRNRFLRKRFFFWPMEYIMENEKAIYLPEFTKNDMPDEFANIKNLREYNEVPPCIYFLVNGKKIVYVGQSVKLTSRFRGHKEKKFNRIFYIPCSPDKLDELERYYINKFLPKYNSDMATMKIKKELKK